MERDEALTRLLALKGKDLRPLADQYGVTVWTARKTLNKGWVGHTVERVLGIPLNSLQDPNGGSWELKTTSLKYLKSGALGLKETLAITMINPDQVAGTQFRDSHLLAKLRSMLVLARIYEGPDEKSAIVYSVGEFDLDDPETYRQVQNDYDLVRDTIKSKGFDFLTGSMGELVQPRSKGPGHGSRSRAFYARTRFLKQIIGI